MKAAVLTQHKHIEIQNLSIPKLEPGECLIKPTYTGICGSDLHIYEGHHPTARLPLVQGHEFMGVIEAMNPAEETAFQVGDRVVAQPLISCGQCEACLNGHAHVCRNLQVLGVHANGSFAEYFKVSLAKTIKVSAGLPDKLAALTEPFAVGFHVMQRGGLQVGDTALVIGAGPIGLIVAMVAKIAGASEVILTEINPDRVAMAEGFGFKVANPKEVEAEKTLLDMTAGAGFDVVFEVSGSQAGLSLAPLVCKIRGMLVPVGFTSQTPSFDILQIILKELHITGSRVYTLEDYKRTVKMLENIVQTQQFDLNQLITGTCDLEDIEQALHDIGAGKSLGKVLVKTA